MQVRSRKFGAAGVYVGRGSRWGNPFTVKAHGRDAAVQMYRQMLLGLLKNEPAQFDDLLSSLYYELRNADRDRQHLVCYCAPREGWDEQALHAKGAEQCHAEVLVRALYVWKERFYCPPPAAK